MELHTVQTNAKFILKNQHQMKTTRQCVAWIAYSLMKLDINIGFQIIAL